MRWSTLARFGWEAMKPPEPKSLASRVSRTWDAYHQVGDACELFNEVLKLSDNEGEKEQSC